MPSVPVCVKEIAEVSLYVAIYLLLEFVTFTVILLCSLILTHWLTRAVLYVSNIDKDRDLDTIATCDILQTILCLWFVCILTLKWIRSWSRFVTPTKLLHFQEQTYPVLTAWLRNTLGMFVMVFASCTQICAYFVKFYTKLDKRSIKKEPQSLKQFFYQNDLKFVGSLYLLAYLFVKVFRYYCEVDKVKMQLQRGEICRRPRFKVYVEQYYGLFGYELFVKDVVLLAVCGLGVILQEDNELYHWFPYAIAALVAVCMGVIAGDVEEHLPWLDNKMERDYPYYRIMHWDARLHIVCFVILPLLSLVHFRNPMDFQPGSKAQLMHNLLHLTISSALWFSLAKGNALFSYVVKGHYWHLRRARVAPLRRLASARHNPGASGERGNGNTNRLSTRVVPTRDIWQREGSVEGDPEEGQQLPEVQRQENRVKGLAGVGLKVKNFVMDHFPVHVTTKRAAGTDHASVSTGTCTSLLNRQQRRSNSIVESVAVGSADAISGSLPDVEISVRPEDEEEEEVTRNEDDHQKETTMVEDVNENDNVSPLLVTTRDNNDNLELEEDEVKATTTNKKNAEVTFSTETEAEKIRLKRCPSTILPVVVPR